MISSGLESVVLGFDARETRPAALNPSDPHDRLFLLRTDLDEVLTADTMLWPSVFDKLEIDWIGMNQPFWEEFSAIRQLVPAVPFRMIAATWHSDIGFEKEMTQQGKLLGPYLPDTCVEADPIWNFLGFDITDGEFISGLSNCGYGEDRDRLTEEWGESLNRSHLFDDLDRALEFRELTNSRVREHAPFFVIGLWSVPMRNF